jgi:hypothetical protein
MPAAILSPYMLSHYLLVKEVGAFYASAQALNFPYFTNFLIWNWLLCDSRAS